MPQVYVDVDSETGAGIVLALVKCETVGTRESPIIEAEVRAKAPTRQWKIVMDLQDVTLLASMGLGMLVKLNTECKTQGGKLIVCNIAPAIMNVMKITRLDRILQMVPDIDAAKKAMA
jgi:anti-anti-sigma factor